MGNKPIIIIAEDNADSRLLYRRMIEGEFPNYVVEEVISGRELQSYLEKILKEGDEEVKLVITDNKMPPGPTGSELIRVYAGREEFPSMLLVYGGIDKIGREAIKDGAKGVHPIDICRRSK